MRGHFFNIRTFLGGAMQGKARQAFMGVMLAIYRLRGCCDVWLEACLSGEWLVWSVCVRDGELRTMFVL